MPDAALDPQPVHRWGSAPDFVGPRHEYRESLMRRMLLPQTPGPRVLNAGCGAGSMTLALLEAGLEVASVDASPDFVAHLSERVAARFPDRHAPVMEGDLAALPHPDGSFDAVVCGEVLEHLDDDAAAARELARVLAPGGLLLASVPAGPDRFDWVDRWAGHRRRYTPGSLAELLRGAGLADVRVTAWGFPLTGLYHRHVYRPLLARRLARGASGDPGAGPSAGPAGRAASRAVRAVLELDTLFLGRRPGWFGLIARARRPAPPAA